MEIKTDVTLPFPRERVFTTYRDRLADLLPYLPNIRGLRIGRAATERGADVDQVNECGPCAAARSPPWPARSSASRC